MNRIVDIYAADFIAGLKKFNILFEIPSNNGKSEEGASSIYVRSPSITAHDCCEDNTKKLVEGFDYFLTKASVLKSFGVDESLENRATFVNCDTFAKCVDVIFTKVWKHFATYSWERTTTSLASTPTTREQAPKIYSPCRNHEFDSKKSFLDEFGLLKNVSVPESNAKNTRARAAPSSSSSSSDDDDDNDNEEDDDNNNNNNNHLSKKHKRIVQTTSSINEGLAHKFKNAWEHYLQPVGWKREVRGGKDVYLKPGKQYLGGLENQDFFFDKEVLLQSVEMAHSPPLKPGELEATLGETTPPYRQVGSPYQHVVHLETTGMLRQPNFASQESNVSEEVLIVNGGENKRLGVAPSSAFAASNNSNNNNSNSGEALLKNKWLHRANEIDEFISIFSTLQSNNYPSPPLLVTGLPCTGKSEIIKDVLVNQQINFGFIRYVECLGVEKKLFELLCACLRGEGSDVKAGAKSIADFYDVVRTCVGGHVSAKFKNFVFVLDDVQQYATLDMSVWKSLLETGFNCRRNVTFVCISSSIETGAGEFDQALTCLPHIARLYFKPYTFPQIVDIIGNNRSQMPNNCPNPEWWNWFVKKIVFSLMQNEGITNVLEMYYFSKNLWAHYYEKVREKSTKEQRSIPFVLSLISEHYKFLTERMYHHDLFSTMTKRPWGDLPHYSMVLLVSSYLCSFNPSWHDEELFLKTKQGKKKTGGFRQKRKSKKKTVPIRWTGPEYFDLTRVERMFSLLLRSVLLGDDLRREESNSLDDAAVEAQVENARLNCSKHVALLLHLKLLGKVTTAGMEDLGNVKYICLGPKNLIEFCCKKLDISSIDEYLYNAD